MGKAFGLLLIVVGLWVGVTIYTEGWDGAVGGVLSQLGLAEPAPARPAEAPNAVTDRVRERVGNLYRDHEERTHQRIGDQ